MKLSGKVALVTGAASGQGAAEAELFVREGALVVGTDIDLAKLEARSSRLVEEFPGRFIAVEHDVTDEAGWASAVHTAESKFGSVNVLINNAGVLFPESYEDVTWNEWNRTMNINAWGQFAGVKAIVNSMISAGGGSIVNIASIASHVNTDGFNPYAASKGAVEAMTRTAADELAKHRIRVNSIHPGEVLTPMLLNNVSEAEIAQREGSIPLGRLGAPEDVAQLALFLASDFASYITGAGVVIDGGASVRYI